MSNLQSKDHAAVIFLNALLLPMNLEVDISTPCNGDCAAAAYVMLMNKGNMTKFGLHWYSNPDFLSEVRLCRRNVADYMNANSIDLRNADGDCLTSAEYAKEEQIVRSQGAYVDVKLFFTALANCKNTPMKVVTMVTQVQGYNENYEIEFGNEISIVPIIDISQLDRATKPVGTLLTFAHAGNPSNHIYATKNIVDLSALPLVIVHSDEDTAITNTIQHPNHDSFALNVSQCDGPNVLAAISALPSGVSTAISALASGVPTGTTMHTIRQVQTIPAPIVFVHSDEDTAITNTIQHPNHDSFALNVPHNGKATLKGASNPSVKQKIDIFLKNSSYRELVAKMDCSVASLQRYLDNFWTAQENYVAFEEKFLKVLSESERTADPIPMLLASGWHSDEINFVRVSIISMGKGKPFLNTLVGPLKLKLYLYNGFKWQVILSTASADDSIVYELSVAPSVLSPEIGVVKVIQVGAPPICQLADCNLLESWKRVLRGHAANKLHLGSLALSGLHIASLQEAMAPRASIVNGQRTLTSYSIFKAGSIKSHILSIPSHLPNQRLTGSYFYSKLDLTTSIPNIVLRSCFRKRIAELGPERLNQLSNILGDLFLYITSELVRDDPVIVLKLICANVSNRGSTDASSNLKSQYNDIISNPVVLRLVAAYNEMDKNDKEGRQRLLTLFVGTGGPDTALLPFRMINELPFKPPITLQNWRAARNLAVAYGAGATIPEVDKRVVRYKIDQITNLVEHVLHPDRTQMYSFGCKEIVLERTGESNKLPSVLRTVPLTKSYEVSCFL